MANDEHIDVVDNQEQSEGGGTATQAPPKEKTAPPKVKGLPPYKVLLHNDDVNDMLHVILTIVELTPLASMMAQAKMWEAHHKGVTLLLVTHKERAELYVDQFKSKKLTVTIEPDEQ